MDLVETFDDADEKEWVMVDMSLPNGANLNHIKGELRFMAEDLVTQIGFKEDGDKIKLGFQSEALRDQVLGYLDPVIKYSIGMDKKTASAVSWARGMQRKGVSLMESGEIEEHRYAHTVEPSQ